MTEQNQDKESGQARYHRVNTEAKALQIDTTGMNTDQIETAIKDVAEVGDTKGPTGITSKEAASIEAKLRYEDEIREKIRAERRIITERAGLIAESESLNIPIDLPDIPTELELARARVTLGVKKLEEKPSPETLAIEAGKRGYYVFTNREQDDASHTVNLGGKYVIHLIPDQVHVLSDFHIKRWRQCAVTPEYKRVDTGVTASDETAGRLMQECKRVGGKPRFAFEHLGVAPQDAPFGLVTNKKVLEELTATV